MADFKEALLYCLQNEGGFVDRKEDRGGPTNMGVTKILLAKFRGRMVSTDEVRLLSDEEAAAIYSQFFWKPLKIEGLPQPIASAIFDTAVNHGQASAIKLAQEALGNSVLPDGVMGEDTLSALMRADSKEFIFNYIGAIQDRYVKICTNSPDQVIFLAGWLKRSRRLFHLVD